MRLLALVPLLCLPVLAGPALQQPHSKQEHAGQKRALLIGVAKYGRGGNPDNEWWDLSSDSDVAALRSLLLDKFGFDQRNVVTLVSRDETMRASILEAFEKLIASTAPGDVVYIHYSGHGTQVLDTSGDEFDGLDESIVPSDYVSRRDGSRNIIDDEIGVLLDRLSTKKPASVLLTFDSCFSGTQTRGGRLVVRGAAYDGPPPKRRDGSDPDPTGLDAADAQAKGYVVISASRDDQIATQTDDESGGSLGLLTFALLKRMREAGPNTTYRDLFEGIFDTMTRKYPAQTPQIEGDLDTVLLDGTAAVPERYVETRIDGERLVLQQGTLHGVTVGSSYALYPRGTQSFKATAPLGTAQVTAAAATTATLTVTDGVERYRLARAIEVAHKYGDSSLRVEVSAVDSLPQSRALSARIDELSQQKGLIRPLRGGTWDLKVCPNACPDQLVAPSAARGTDAALKLIRPDGSLVTSLQDSQDLPERFTDAVEREARWRMVANLERHDPRVAVEIRLVPADVTLDADRKVTAAVARRGPIPLANGKPVMSLGDYFMVDVRNTGSLDAYVTVLDLSPDGTLNPIWPNPRIDRGAQDNKVKAESPDNPQRAPWRRIPFPYVFRIDPPSGNEILKAIATDVPADFSTLTTPQTRGEISRGEQEAARTPVGRLLASVTRPSTRGPSLATAPADPTSWSAYSFTFVIAPSPPR